MNICLVKIYHTDLAHLKKLNLSNLHWICHLVNHLKKIRLKVVINMRMILIMTAAIDFTNIFKGYDEFKEMSLDSKYNRMKEFNKLLINFKALRPNKPKTQLKKEQIMRNVDENYEKYYHAYKNDYETDDELDEAKKKTN